MFRGGFLAGSVLVVTTPAPAAEPWALVTPDEVARARAAGPLSATRSIPRPGAPQIVMEQPDPAKPLRPPLSFRLRFVPAAGATIDPPTLRATYGALGLDITGRLPRHARLTARTLTTENVSIPPGEHTVTLTIADNAGRIGSRTFHFTVL